MKTISKMSETMSREKTHLVCDVVHKTTGYGLEYRFKFLSQFTCEQLQAFLDRLVE